MAWFLSRWPAWYAFLVLHCLYLGFEAYLYQTGYFGLATAAANESTPRNRGWVTEYRTRLFSGVVGWPLAALALLTGGPWAQAVVAVAFLVSAPSTFRRVATWFAEDLKASQSESSIANVQGLVRPPLRAYLAAAGSTLLTRILPALALFYAIAVN